jgi:hypothetical protein
MKPITLLCMLWGSIASPAFLNLNSPKTDIPIIMPSGNVIEERADVPIELNHSKAIQSALDGLTCLKEKNKHCMKDDLIIIDYSLPSSVPRLIVFDAKMKEVALRVHVAHGKGSGMNQAASFSNEPSSFKSSLGFFKIGDAYQGKHGLAFRLIGLEPGINDNAFQRGIVIHSADYVEEKFIRALGRAGRSLGCPAVSFGDLKRLAPFLQKDRLLFIYAPEPDYFRHSRFFR